MTRDKTNMPAFFDAKLEYELTPEQIVEALRQYTGLADGMVSFDVSPKGKLRGATVRAMRTEIKG